MGRLVEIEFADGVPVPDQGQVTRSRPLDHREQPTPGGGRRESAIPGATRRHPTDTHLREFLVETDRFAATLTRADGEAPTYESDEPGWSSPQERVFSVR